MPTSFCVCVFYIGIPKEVFSLSLLPPSLSLTSENKTVLSRPQNDCFLLPSTSRQQNPISPSTLEVAQKSCFCPKVGVQHSCIVIHRAGTHQATSSFLNFTETHTLHQSPSIVDRQAFRCTVMRERSELGWSIDNKQIVHRLEHFVFEV